MDKPTVQQGDTLFQAISAENKLVLKIHADGTLEFGPDAKPQDAVDVIMGVWIQSLAKEKHRLHEKIYNRLLSEKDTTMNDSVRIGIEEFFKND